MKRPVLFILSLLFSAISFGQNYEPLTPGVNRYFSNSSGYLRGMRIDSVATVGSDVIYYPFHSPRNYYQVLDDNGGSWLGKNVIKQPDGTFLFDNLWQDTVVIKTQALLNDSWIMYDDATNIHYLATVTAIDTMTILGGLDSIKTVTVTAYDNLQILSSDPLNNVEIKISKAHGFVQAVDLFTFPMHEPGLVYQSGFDILLDKNPPTNVQNILFKLIDFHVPTLVEIYDFEIGDVFGKKGWNVGFYDKEMMDTVMYKNIVNANQIEYTIRTNKKVISNMGWVYTSTLHTETATNAPAFTMSGMPEESGEQHYYYYYPYDTSRCYVSPAYKLESNFIYTSSYGSCGVREIYKQKFGQKYYHQCFSLDPGDSESDWMVYSKKNGQPCGYLANPVNIQNTPDVSNATTIYPNPVSDILFIKNETKEQLHFSLSNIYGQLLQSSRSNERSIQINVTDLAPGIYNLRINSGTGNTTSKTVLIHH